MNTLSAGFVDSLASILGSPPAYTLTPSRPPPLNLRKDARSAAPAVSDPSNPPLHVTQYAPAYGLQLLLRVHGVHHLVLNTDYRRCQNNSAAYPLLTDIQDGVNYYFPSSIVGGGGGGSYAKEVELSASDNDPPHLPPTPLGEPLAHIVKFYIPSLLEEIPDSSVALYTSLLTSILSPLLLSLSFADNGIGYESTRALHSTPLPSFLPEPFLTFLSLVNSVKDNLTLWAEKVSVVRSLPFPGQFSSSSVPTRCRNGVSFLSASSSIHLDVPAALIQASNAYRILSDHLSSNPSTTSSPHFFNSPTFFDPLLFEHLYSAIVNPHLVKILRSQPLLLSYFTTMVETYFFEAERTNERQTNDEANEDNPRDRLRQAYNFAKKAANSSSFSAQADSAANAIKMEQNHVVKKNRSLLNFHRLRFGGAMVTDKGSASPPPPLPLSEPLQAQKNALENDNIKWFTGVGVAVGMYLVWGRVQVRIK